MWTKPPGLTPGVPPFALRAIAFGDVRSGILPSQSNGSTGQPKGWPSAPCAEGESHGWDEHIPPHATHLFDEALAPQVALAYLAERELAPKPHALTSGFSPCAL